MYVLRFLYFHVCLRHFIAESGLTAYTAGSSNYAPLLANRIGVRINTTLLEDVHVLQHKLKYHMICKELGRAKGGI